jgi:hypothetical protein
MHVKSRAYCHPDGRLCKDRQGKLQCLTFPDTTNILLCIRSDLAEDMSSLSLSDSDSDASTICSKDDSQYSDSDYDSDDKKEMLQELGHDPNDVYNRRRNDCVIL